MGSLPEMETVSPEQVGLNQQSLLILDLRPGSHGYLMWNKEQWKQRQGKFTEGNYYGALLPYPRLANSSEHKGLGDEQC